MEGVGELDKDYKQIKDVLNLVDNKEYNKELKGLLRNITGIINQIDSLTNKTSERHRPIYEPKYHHAKFVIDSAFTISDFLINVMKYQNSRVSYHYEKLLSLAHDMKQKELEDICQDNSIKAFLSKNDDYIVKPYKRHIFEYIILKETSLRSNLTF